MSEMVERAARAFCKARGSDPDWTGYQSGPTDDARPNWVRQAEAVRVILESMREPTEAMLMATDLTTTGEAYAAWQAMIDEALKP